MSLVDFHEPFELNTGNHQFMFWILKFALNQGLLSGLTSFRHWLLFKKILYVWCAVRQWRLIYKWLGVFVRRSACNKHIAQDIQFWLSVVIFFRPCRNRIRGVGDGRFNTRHRFGKTCHVLCCRFLSETNSARIKKNRTDCDSLEYYHFPIIADFTFMWYCELDANSSPLCVLP